MHLRETLLEQIIGFVLSQCPRYRLYNLQRFRFMYFKERINNKRKLVTPSMQGQLRNFVVELTVGEQIIRK